MASLQEDPNNSMTAEQFVESMSNEHVVQGYVAQHLHVAMGAKILLKEIIVHFRATTHVGEAVLNNKDLTALLLKTTEGMGPEWVDNVVYYNMRKNNEAGMGYKNMALSPQDPAPPVPEKECDRDYYNTVVRPYVLQNIKIESGGKIRMCELCPHFRANVEDAGKQITDAALAQLLLEAMNESLDPAPSQLVTYKSIRTKGLERRMGYVGVAFVTHEDDAMEVDAHNPEPAGFEQSGDVGSFSYRGHHLHEGFVDPYGADEEDQYEPCAPPIHFQPPSGDATAPEPWQYPGEKTEAYYTWENDMLAMCNDIFGPKSQQKRHRKAAK